MRRKMFVAFVTIVMLLSSTGSLVFAAEYPQKPIEMTIGFAAGVSADIVGRKLAGIAEKELGKPIVISNRGGAGGALAYQYMAQQKPDGYSIIWISNSISTTYFQGNMPLSYKDFTMVAGISSEQSVIAVKADAPWKTFKDFIEDAKKNPTQISVGNGGLGSFNHLTAVAIENAVGVKFHHIPFGTSVVPSLLGGHVDSSCTMAFSNIPLAKSGELRLLASTGDTRLESIKDVPTMKELGYDFSMFMYRGIAVPKGTPQVVVKKLEAAFKKAVESDEFKEYARQNAMEITWMNSEEFTTFVKKDHEFLGDLMTQMGTNKR